MFILHNVWLKVWYVRKHNKLCAICTLISRCVRDEDVIIELVPLKLKQKIL